jgi:hypothetical protein
MPRQIVIDKPKQLLAEGNEAVSFFKSFLSHIHLVDFQIQNFGGTTELREYLLAFSKMPGFSKIVTSLAIIRDAESDPNAAFTSVCSSLLNSNLPVPSVPTNLSPGPPRVGVYILPDSSSTGMLETLCLRAVNGDPVMRCLDLYFDCCLEQLGYKPAKVDKARLRAFLASRERPELPLGPAGSAGHLNFASNEYNAIKAFLSSF